MACVGNAFHLMPLSYSSNLSKLRSTQHYHGELFVGRRRIDGLGAKLVVEKKRVASVVVCSGESKSGGVLRPSSTSLSDVIWPSAGAFAAMALLGNFDKMMAPKGITFTIPPLGAVCAVLFASPSSPAAKKENMFVAQMGCAAFGVLALTLFGPGWLARSSALAASVGFMVATGAMHPPAASLPIMFIDGAKFHQLNFWYILFPGAASCLILCLIQEIVSFLKTNVQF